MLSALRKLFFEKLKSEEKAQKDQSLGSWVAEAAERFRDWLAARSGEEKIRFSPDAISQVDRAFEDYKDSRSELPEALAADAAAFLGEVVRRGWQSGEWREDPLWGIVLERPGGLEFGRFNPLGLVERKWNQGKGFSLAEFFSTLDRRFQVEKEALRPPVPSPQKITAEVSGKEGEAAAAEAARLAAELRAWWGRRHGTELPLSLNGLRLFDRFLRENYFANFLEEGTMVLGGFYLGEVIRGLFGGEWDFRNLQRADRARLSWPEISYFPAGRVYKMMLECPAAEPLDEYARLVPAARQEMREQHQSEESGSRREN